MKFVTAPDGVNLAYDDQGSGTPLLCLPGLTRNMEDFDTIHKVRREYFKAPPPASTMVEVNKFTSSLWSRA